MGQPPVPLSQFVLKVHSRCDLACDHCYVYEAADQSWRGRPMVISAEVVRQAAQRIAEHARVHALKTVQVILHGGEPLLAGHSRLERIITALQAAADGVCHLDLRIHTNGVLLSEAFCELFAEHGVKVGISLDGDRAANDRHRRYADGRSSYGKVIAAIGLLRRPQFRHLYAGLLCTIDIANDPLAVYDSLVALEPPRIDFLLPHATWDSPPARNRPGDTEYADWLIAIYDRWNAHGRPVQIRTFDSILSTLAGGHSFTEALGLEPASLAVIETDGSYEQVDSLKAAFDGAPDTGTNVFDHDLDTVARHPGIRARQQGIAGLCDTCQRCPVVTSCGGGLYTHRYRTSNGFGNPSVFCTDLLKLITHISGRPPAGAARRASIPAHALSRTELESLAAGAGDAVSVTHLINAQDSLLRALLATVYQEAASGGLASPVGVGLRAAWSLLATLDRAQPQALVPVLRHPYVRVWAVRCLEQLRSAAAPHDGHLAGGSRGLPADLGHLGSIAAAAAIRARAPAVLTVAVVDSAVHLPTLGRLTLGGPGGGTPEDGPEVATVKVADDAVTVEAGPRTWTLSLPGLLAGASGAAAADSVADGWEPVRTLSAAGLTVSLEDTDLYRDCQRWAAASRLTEGEYARWQCLFQAAWQEIERNHGTYGAALAAGLTSLVPLTATQDGRDVSGTFTHAPGAIVVACPGDPITLAFLLICEFQCVKLGAVLDLYDLYDRADNRLFASPWQEGKQHLDDLFRDAFAHLAGSEFWRVRERNATGTAAVAARQRFVQGQAETSDAIETLSGSGSLTPLGMSFVHQMRRSGPR